MARDYSVSVPALTAAGAGPRVSWVGRVPEPARRVAVATPEDPCEVLARLEAAAEGDFRDRETGPGATESGGHRVWAEDGRESQWPGRYQPRATP